MDSNPDCIAYGEPSYWDFRYNAARQREGIRHTFDWYVGFKEIWPIIETYCGENTGFKVLILGCGSSLVTEELYNKGFTQITAMDISATLIGHLQHRYQDKEGMEFIVGDARTLSRFEDNSIDFVLEKGMIDSLFCGVSSYNSVLALNQEVYRVLKRGSNFMSVGNGPPKTRLPHFNHVSLPWEVDHTKIPGRQSAFAYTMTKSEDAEERYIPSTMEIIEDNFQDTRVFDDFSNAAHVSMTLKSSEHTGFIRLSRIRDADGLLEAYKTGKIKLSGADKSKDDIV